jgi:hypothetical protein
MIPRPQQEYIIAEDKLRQLEMRFIYHNMEKDEPEVFTARSEFMAEVRSRPHTSTPQIELQPSFDIIDDLERQLKFYKDRINYLQCWQSSMRDPERKIVCDILANGFTLTTKEDVDNADTAIAQSARDQALKEFGILAIKEIEESPETWKRAPMTVLMTIIQSLRTPKEQL